MAKPLCKTSHSYNEKSLGFTEKFHGFFLKMECDCGRWANAEKGPFMGGGRSVLPKQYLVWHEPFDQIPLFTI